MALRRVAMQLLPRLATQQGPAAAAAPSAFIGASHLLQPEVPAFGAGAVPFALRGYGAAAPASSSVALVKPSTSEVASTALGQLSLSPSNKITYNDYNHARFAPGTEGRPFAYFVQTGGRFLYASAIRVVVLKALVSLSAAADTLALSSLEVDLTGLEEGSTITVKWRGKPVFIQHRTDEQIASAASVALTDLKDPQKDIDRVVDPKYLIVIGVCTHLGCVPIAGAGNYGGWFCPCHGSHYDGSGRIREGPAPYNLEIPEYRFTEGKVIIG